MRFIVEPGIGASFAMGSDVATPRHFARWIEPGMTVFDVGANKGQMALLFAALVGPSGRVVSFEPAPAESGSLQRNLALNGLDYVEVVPAAAADAEGTLLFAYAPDLPTQGRLIDDEARAPRGQAETFSVPALTLDGVALRTGPPDVIKVDVEGAAAAVLRGAGRLLDEASPCVYLELHGPEEQAGVRDELLARGYVAETMAGVRVVDPTKGWHSPLWCHRPASPDPL